MQVSVRMYVVLNPCVQGICATANLEQTSGMCLHFCALATKVQQECRSHIYFDGVYPIFNMSIATLTGFTNLFAFETRDIFFL